MTAPAYYCLGGPLHGQMKAEPEGKTRLSIHILAAESELGNVGATLNGEPMPIDAADYELRDHHRFGKAWVYVDPREEA